MSFLTSMGLRSMLRFHFLQLFNDMVRYWWPALSTPIYGYGGPFARTAFRALSWP
jgi:hypothetical protein